MRDPSPSIIRHVESSGDLAPGERAMAGVKVSHEGTFGAAISAAGRASDGVPDLPEQPQLEQGAADARSAGLDARGPHFAVALTDRRVLVYRRSVFGRLKDLVWEVPLDAVDEVSVNRSGRVQVVLADGRTLSLESPRANLKHLPDVYRDLPGIFEQARADGPTG